ncbi:MAG TPA: lysophospholipid acyltransferase family protein [Bauldia sp.]|nr:lysophospholipid acyltransferase family protein [Bauldia sp.]
MTSALRLALTIFVLGIFTIVFLPVQLIGLRRGWKLASDLPYVWQRLAWWLMGMRVTVIGKPAKPPLLIAANHVSWLDVTVLGGILKPLSFVAKAEVASWPILGTLARLQRTIFIDRERKLQTGLVAGQVAKRVASGEIVVLFAEGTTGDGNRVLPFRSALIGAAGAVTRAEIAAVQPVAISYVRIQGVPVGRSDRPAIAWYGDMDFVAHFRRIIGRGAMDVVVSFGEPIPYAPGTNRKAVAEICYQEVRRMVEDIRTGRSRNLGPQEVFSPPAKEAKGTQSAPGRCMGEPGQEIANRAS